jgi:hypothetical protein
LTPEVIALSAWYDTSLTCDENVSSKVQSRLVKYHSRQLIEETAFLFCCLNVSSSFLRLNLGLNNAIVDGTLAHRVAK